MILPNLLQQHQEEEETGFDEIRNESRRNVERKSLYLGGNDIRAEVNESAHDKNDIVWHWCRYKHILLYKICWVIEIDRMDLYVLSSGYVKFHIRATQNTTSH